MQRRPHTASRLLGFARRRRVMQKSRDVCFYYKLSFAMELNSVLIFLIKQIYKENDSYQLPHLYFIYYLYYLKTVWMRKRSTYCNRVGFLSFRAQAWVKNDEPLEPKANHRTFHPSSILPFSGTGSDETRWMLLVNVAGSGFLFLSQLQPGT